MLKNATFAWQKQLELIDITDADQVLDFAYEYLRRRARPPTDDAVREITAVLAKWREGVIPYDALDSMVQRTLGNALVPRPKPHA